MNFHHIGRSLLDLLFPIFCLGCGAKHTYCCARCFAQIELFSEHLFAAPPPIKNIVAAGPHDETKLLTKLIHLLKYEGAQEVAPLLGDIFQQKRSSSLPLITIPVPLHFRRMNMRGFNQSELIARRIAERWHGEMQPLLTRHRYTPPQVDLSREERLRNVHGAFSLRTKQSLPHDAVYLLVDDVVTTGATIRECAVVLKEHGAEHIYGLVVAKS